MALTLSERIPLGVFPTPLRPDERLADALGVPDLWVKRDDLTGFAFGGNKVRPAEFIAGDAVARGVTDIVLSGGPSSNFAATMASAGRLVGIVIHQVVYGPELEVFPPALLAGAQSGARLTFTGSSDRATMEIVAARLAAELCDRGRIAITIPRGGATTVGANGFVAAAIELAEQLDREKIERSTIVIPVGSGGSVAGLLAGRALLGAPWSIIGASVSRPADTSKVDIIARAGETVRALGGSPEAAAEFSDFRLVDCRGDGFGTVTAEEAAFCRHVGETTGLLIDHTYNTKPLRWLAQHHAELEGPIIYWLTGSTLGAISDAVSSTHDQPGEPTEQRPTQGDNKL